MVMFVPLVHDEAKQVNSGTLSLFSKRTNIILVKKKLCSEKTICDIYIINFKNIVKINYAIGKAA